MLLREVRRSAEAIIENSMIAEGDVILVISTSGKNAAPVAVAEKALLRGAKLIIISSSFYRNAKGNHTRLASLWQLENRALIVDNHVPCGDASIQVGMCPMDRFSTIAWVPLFYTLFLPWQLKRFLRRGELRQFFSALMPREAGNTMRLC